MGKIIYPDESYKIIGASFEVYNTMGKGFTEPIYQECLEDYREFHSNRRPNCLCSIRTKNFVTSLSPISYATKKSSWRSNRWRN